jgi:hypothetical protein
MKHNAQSGLRRFIGFSDTIQSDDTYEVVAPIGAGFDARFQPFHTPPDLVAMGVFEDKYCNDCSGEFPKE